MNCDMIDKLYYLEAKQTAMLINQNVLDRLLRLFDSGECQTGRFWMWKVSNFHTESHRKMTSFNTMLMDNALYWKEDLFVAIEWQKLRFYMVFFPYS